MIVATDNLSKEYAEPLKLWENRSTKRTAVIFSRPLVP